MRILGIFCINRGGKQIALGSILACLFLFLSGCQYYSKYFHPPVKPPLPAIAAHPITQTRVLPNFSQVMVKGRVNIRLHTGASKPRVVIQADTKDLEQVHTLMKGYTLCISIGKGYPQHGPITMDIYAKQLNSFSYDGIGVVRGTNLYTRYLDLSINNPESTLFSGNIGLRRLYMRGPGMIQLSNVSGHDIQIAMAGNPRIQLIGLFSLGTLDLRGDGLLSAYWIKSDRLIIREHGHAHVQLAGVVKVLEVTLWDAADFNGRYLRAYRAFVKTHGRSTAKISAVRRQHTLASDASNIYFYNLPEMKTDFMAYNGSVLDMRDWNLYFEQEYTRYNSQY